MCLAGQISENPRLLRPVVKAEELNYRAEGGETPRLILLALFLASLYFLNYSGNQTLSEIS